MKKLLLLAFALALLNITAQAQRVCGTNEHLQEQLKADPAMQQRMQSIEEFTNQYLLDNPPAAGERAVVTIPVVVHVVWWTGNSASNISDAQIASQLDVMNADFRALNSDIGSVPAAFAGLVADCEVNFCMAQRDPSGNATTGIIRKSSSTQYWGTNDAVKYTSNGGDNAWPMASYLNLWVCGIGSGILGYAQFPGGPAATDGVVIDWHYFGTIGTVTPPFDKGRTATHEVGHWLNLRHIWGDANCGNDLVSDTPIHTNANYGCPAYPTNSTCGGTSHAMMTMNYMDYTDDACMYMFTVGQKARQQALFASGGARASLLNSQGCVPPSGGSCGTPTGLAASAITQTSATLGWAAVASATNYNLQWKPTSSGTWTTVSAISTTSYNLTGLTAGTSYDFKVQANCNGTLGSYSTAVSFTTTASGGGGNCTENNEPNNSLSTAKPTTPGTATLSQISTATDKDYWSFANISSAKNVKVDLTTLPADYDLKLYKGSTLLGTSQNAGTSSEQLKYNTNSVSTNFSAYVYGYNGAYSTTQCYTLLVSLSATAWREDGTTSGPVEQVQLEAQFENAGFGLFPNPTADQFTVEVPVENEGQAIVSLFDLTGKQLAAQTRSIDKSDNQFVFAANELHNGMYLVRVQMGDSVKTRKLTVHR